MNTAIKRVRSVVGNRIQTGLIRIVHQGQCDAQGELIPLRPLIGAANQRLMEAGFSPPWILSADECRNLWRNIEESGGASGNRPADYAEKDQAIVSFLRNFWSPEVKTQDELLELGCNAGANLHGLFGFGYQRLSAIEINPDAVATLRARFSELVGVPVQIGSLEEVLPTLRDNSVDVIFTMAVLIHVHPHSNFIFKHMARVARRHIVVIEAERANCGHFFARNYRRVFERHGCVQLRSALITKQAYPPLEPAYWGYTARLFTVG